jgi:glycosyltransferase involved in cell wall biosynthesis
MKKRNIHVVRTHKYRASLYGRISAFLAHIPVVLSSIHGNYRKDLRLERKIANKILARVTDRIIAVSESIKQDILKYDNIESSKVLVIRNGVDISKFDPERKFHDIRREFAISENDIIIGFIGRLVPAKGLEYLIDAFLHLEKEQKNIKLFITGEGSILDNLKGRSQRDSINKRIIFTGKRYDIPDILSGIDIFVMPSLAEGLPNSLLEAMAMGKPIIATSVGGIPEVIKNEINGILVSPRDLEGLVTAIKKLIANKNYASEIGKRARNYVIENLSIQATTRKWESLYISLLKEKGITISKDTEKVNA